MRWDVVVLVISGMIMGVSSVMLGLSLSRYREERSLRRRGSAPDSTRDTSGNKLLKRAIYNADTGSLDLIFGEPVILSKRSSLLLVHGAGGRLESCSTLDLGAARVTTADGQLNDCVLVLAVPDGTRRRILEQLEGDCARIMLVIFPGAIHSVASGLSDITEVSGDKPMLVTDMDIRHEH